MDFYVMELLSKYSPMSLLFAPWQWFPQELTHFFPFCPPKEHTVGKEFWGSRSAYTTLISEALVPGTEKQLFVPGTEAIVATLVDNNHAKWGHMMEYYVKKKSYDVTLPRKMKKNLREQSGNGDPNAKYHDAKYSTSDKGNIKNGAFAEAGIDYFCQLAKQIKEHRDNNSRDVQTWEKAYQKKLRERNLVEENTGDEGKNGKRKAGDGGGKPKKKAKYDLTFDDDEED